ncbi:ATP-binding cassette domain-containing protein, partial [Thioclava sp. BHET1]
MFSLDALSLRRGSRTLIAPLSMTISGGCLTAILGPNGAGKSTLLRLLSGEIRPTSGAIHLDGQALARIPPHQLAKRRAMLA